MLSKNCNLKLVFPLAHDGTLKFIFSSYHVICDIPCECVVFEPANLDDAVEPEAESHRHQGRFDDRDLESDKHLHDSVDDDRLRQEEGENDQLGPCVEQQSLLVLKDFGFGHVVVSSMLSVSGHARVPSVHPHSVVRI